MLPAVCAALATACLPAPAVAQDATIGIQRPRTSAQPRPQPAPQPADLGEAAPNPDLPAVIPADDPSITPEAPDDLEPAPRVGQRPVRKDGDLSEPDAPQLRDGVIDTAEPVSPQDGIDPTAIDTRTADEAALFDAPPTPSTLDQLLFQVEDLDPILDRRPERLFRFEPYDPVGIRVGSFVLFPQVELSGDAFSNVLRAPKARSDISFDVRPSVQLVSNWRSHALEFRASGTAAFFNAFETENDKAYTLETRSRLDISKRTNLQASLSHDLSQESRSVLEARNVGTRADATVDKATLALNHRFNRLSLQLRGAVTDTAFGDSSTAGVTFSNATRDYRASEQAARASWEFKPTLSAFTEVVLNQRDYNQVDASGIDRSSAGERIRTGLSFGNTGEILRGEVSAGWGEQRPSTTLPTVSGLIVDANVTWRVNALTSVLATARSDFAETTVTGVGGIKVQAVGLDLRHAFHRYLIGTAGISYSDAQYAGSTLAENELRETLGLEYFLNRETVLFGRYAHANFNSNAANASYDSNEVRLGVRIRR